MLKKIGVFLLIFLGFFFINTIGEVYSAPVSGEINNIKKLSVDKITVLGENKLEILFSNDILADNELDFTLKHLGIEEDFSNIDSEGKIKSITDVKKIDVNGKKVYLFPDNKFKNSQEYEVVIISVTDINKNTIETGLDGAIKFIVPADFEEKQKAKRKDLILKRNYRKKKMLKILGEIRKELYLVSDIEFETTMEVEEALRKKQEADRKRQEYQNQLEKEKEAKKLEEIRKKEQEEKRKKALEAEKKRKLEEEKRKKELEKLSEIERQKAEEEKKVLESAGNQDLTSTEDLEGRNIIENNLSNKEVTSKIEPIKTEDLPITGPREYLIFIFSLILVSLIFYFRRQKKA